MAINRKEKEGIPKLKCQDTVYRTIHQKGLTNQYWEDRKLFLKRQNVKVNCAYFTPIITTDQFLKIANKLDTLKIPCCVVRSFRQL